jgi:hypothetical protein
MRESSAIFQEGNCNYAGNVTPACALPCRRRHRFETDQ